MPPTARYELTRRDLESRGVDLDKLVRAAREEGLGWRLVARRIAEQAGYTHGPTFVTVRRWYEGDQTEAAA